MIIALALKLEESCSREHEAVNIKHAAKSLAILVT